ncbi:MAG: glutamate-cysteine ligase family protein, partial [Pseudomonadota bacterium]
MNQPQSTTDDFTLGIEEEYLLVDVETGQLAIDPPRDLMLACSRELGPHVSPELMQSQIEVGTVVCRTAEDARSELRNLRITIGDITAHYGLAPIAASTHPFAKWLDQKQTEKTRYMALTREMQGAARRLLICGMHVHVGISQADLR